MRWKIKSKFIKFLSKADSLLITKEAPSKVQTRHEHDQHIDIQIAENCAYLRPTSNTA